MKRPALPILVSILLIVTLCAHTAIVKKPPPYRVVTEAARNIVQGQSPYAPQPNLDFFKYSPLAGLAMLPFSLLPDAWGTFLFLLFQCLLFLWAFGRWARAAGYDLSRSVAAQWIALASVLLDATASLQNGQWNVGLFALMLLGAAQYAEGKSARAGLVLSLATNLKLYPFALGFCFLTGLKKRFWGAFLGGLVLWFLLPSLLVGTGNNLRLLREWFGLMSWDLTREREMLDIGSFLSIHFNVDPSLRTPLAVFVGLVIGALTFHLFRKGKEQLVHRFVIPLNGLYVLLFSYLSESPTSVLATAGIFVIGMQALEDERHRRVYWLLWIFSLALIPVSYSDLVPHAASEWARGLRLKTAGYVYLTLVLGMLLWKRYSARVSPGVPPANVLPYT